MSVPITLPRSLDEAAFGEVVEAHVREVERDQALARLGDVREFVHLEPHLRRFLQDHSDPERNVFIMMRFLETEQFGTIHDVIREALAQRGYEGLRADDRDYTGELWTNLEAYMVGCRYGVAVFEDIEERAFNPNVALELGWMLGRRKRCLILKERRLPTLPTDVIGHLYKAFDQFNIEKTVRTEVLRWLDVDLRNGYAGAGPQPKAD